MPAHRDSLARDFRPAIDDLRIRPRLDRTHGGNIDASARSIGVQPKEIIDFSASINPLGPRTALVIGPAFSEYANALALVGSNIRSLSLTVDDAFQLSPERLMAAWEKNCDLLVLTTPNSLTGRLIPKREIENIARRALVRKSFVVVDEAFIDFVEEESVKMLVQHNPFVIVLRSLTKYYALPGLRLGYLIGQARRVAQLAAFREPWSVNGPALSVALACLTDAGFAAKTERWLERERTFLLQGLTKLDGL